MDENEMLNELLAGAKEVSRDANGLAGRQSPPRDYAITNFDVCQWQIEPNGVYRPGPKTSPMLPPGAYGTDVDNRGPFFKGMTLMSDDIVSLPETVNIRILAGIQKFWGSRSRYESAGLLFKRGILLWGPPGSGKTVTIHLLAKDLISNDGLVLFCSDPGDLIELLAPLRKIEPNRPIIIVLEDVDEIIHGYGEHKILALLDGEHQTSNVVYIATTNYPEKLGARIVNRPSRFDERIMVGMPSVAARTAYFQKTADLEASELDRWVEATDQLSIAHLRELVAAVRCLDQDFDDVIKRLRSMMERPKDEEGYAKRKLGLI